MSHRQTRFWLATSALALSITASATDIIQCPIGTNYLAPANASARIRLETCVDALGRKQGPFRLRRNNNGTLSAEGTYRDGFFDGVLRDYSDSGVLLEETLYAGGALIAQVPTLATFQAALNEENIKANTEGKQQTLTMLDRHTLGIDYVKNFPLSILFAAVSGKELNEEIRHKLASNPAFCQAFQLPENPILRVRARWFDGHGKLLGETWIRKEECRDQAAP